METQSTTQFRQPPANSGNSQVERYVQVAEPQRLFFAPTCFRKKCKVTSNCSPDATVAYLRDTLSVNEISWFLRHPQFRHVFHRHEEKSHKVQGMWSLILRTVDLKKEKELWFVVNGFPVRYSIKEHALITGFDCSELPANYENEIGPPTFINKYFTDEKIHISAKAVREELEKMGEGEERSGDRLKMAVLYFLGTVINPKNMNARIDDFLLRVVDDLKFCKSFPWGTFTFLRCIENVRHWLKEWKGRVKPTWTIPGFTIAFELLAFECIQPLKSKFRENIHNAKNGCPRMCMSKFKDTTETGYSLQDIYDVIGKTKRIQSVLFPNPEEQHLLDNVFEDDGDKELTADSWTELLTQHKRIFWEDLYVLDQAHREVEETTETTEGINNRRAKAPNVPEREGGDKEVRRLEKRLRKKQKRSDEQNAEQLAEIRRRLAALEGRV